MLRLRPLQVLWIKQAMSTKLNTNSNPLERRENA